MSKLSAFVNLIKFLWQHPQQLLNLLQGMVTAMHTTGQGIEIAGNGAIAASQLFTGGPNVPVSSSQTLEAAADAIEAARTQIENAADLIDDAATTIGNVKVPTVTPTYITLPIGVQPDGSPWRVVNGLSLGQVSAFGQVRNALRSSANRIEDFGQDLQGAANNVRSLKGALNTAGQDFSEMGVALRDSGRVLQELTTD
jgi:hypothetical protein